MKEKITGVWMLIIFILFLQILLGDGGFWPVLGMVSCTAIASFAVNKIAADEKKKAKGNPPW